MIAMISMTRSIWAAIVASVGPSVTCGPAGNEGNAGGGAFDGGGPIRGPAGNEGNADGGANDVVGRGAKSSFQSTEKYIRTRKQLLK